LKSKNLLITQTGVLKLADFGGAKEAAALLSSGLLEATVGLQATPLWMAPELVHSRFNCKADVWSLGCTIIEMATRKNPWNERNFANVFAVITFLEKVKGGPPMPKNLSVAAQAFLARCFIKDHTLRPTATELLADDWFRTETGSLESPFAFSTSSSNSSSAASTGSETPQGPSASTPTGPNNSASASTSLTEVKFNVGGGVLSQSLTEPSGFAGEHEEEMKRNWIFDLAPSSTGTTARIPTTPAVVAPDKLLSTMDFLSMKSSEDD
jgi:serine/threonine protein kinase